VEEEKDKSCRVNLYFCTNNDSEKVEEIKEEEDGAEESGDNPIRLEDAVQKE